MVTKETIEILKDPLVFNNTLFDKEIISKKSIEKIYEVEHGIAKFIKENEIEGSNKKYLKLYDKILNYSYFKNKL